MNKQLADLKFNNTEIENNIRLLVNNDREPLIQPQGSNKSRELFLGKSIKIDLEFCHILILNLICMMSKIFTIPMPEVI